MKYIHEYEALNGRQCFRITRGFENVTVALGGDVDQELADFYQARRDEELGRWRDPENPDMVCYPVECDLNAVWVVYEGDGSRYLANRTRWEDIRPHYVSEAAGRYFAAHPEPKPWDAAQPDEIWVLTINDDTEEVFRCGGNGLYSPKTGNPIGSLLSCSHNKITAGRRIWPEEDK